MAIEVIMPKLTHEMSSGVLVRWLVQEGSQVSEGDVLFEVETDKAVNEVTAETSGIIKAINARDGSEIPVGQVMAWITQADEDIPVDQQMEDAQPIEQKQIELEVDYQLNERKLPVFNGRIAATPVARKMAEEFEVDLAALKGTGPNGRIIERDVQASLASKNKPSVPDQQTQSGLTYRDIQLDSKTRIMATRMLESITQIPQFSVEVRVDLGELEHRRANFQADSDQRISMTAVFVRAAALALDQYKLLNASYSGEGIVRVYNDINIGIALQSPHGLLVPVIHAAGGKKLTQVQRILDEFKDKANRNKFLPVDLDGGTFTISNLGMCGVERFNAIINPPQAGILAIGKAMDEPVRVDGEFVFDPVIHLCLTADHRFITGAYAAQFLGDLAGRLEEPQEIFSEI